MDNGSKTKDGKLKFRWFFQYILNNKKFIKIPTGSVQNKLV